MEIAGLLATRPIPQNLINLIATAEGDSMSEASQPDITQNIDINTGQAKAIATANSDSLSQASQPSVTQNIGSNTGQAQAIAAKRDVNATQRMSQGEVAEAITQEEVVEILRQIETLIKESDLPSGSTSQATKYAGKAKSPTFYRP